MKITEAQFKLHRRSYDGYCPECDGITREGSTEPDAENYECHECEGMTVLGMDYALMGEYFEFVDEMEYEDEDDV